MARMKWLNSVMLLVGGMAAGYVCYPLMHPVNKVDTQTTQSQPLPAITLPPLAFSPVDQPASPAVVASGVAPQPTNNRVETKSPFTRSTATDYSADSDRTDIETKQVVAFDQAAAIVDEMIFNRQVSEVGLAKATLLLQASGQGARSFELVAQVMNAVDAGELTAEQAGIGAVFELDDSPN